MLQNGLIEQESNFKQLDEFGGSNLEIWRFGSLISKYI